VSRLSALALSKRSVVLLLAFAVVLGGIYSWTTLKQELVPDIEFPVVSVVTTDPGVGANDVTDQVTKPVEQAISSVPRLVKLQSTSAASVSIVVAQFSFGTDIKDTRTTIEQALANAGLPSGLTPSVNAFNINAAPVIIAAVSATGDASLDQVGGIARTVIVPQLSGLDGVAAVDLTGGLEQRAVVTLDPAKLSSTGIPASQVAAVLGANNLTLPSGQVTQGGINIPVSTTHRFGSVDEIGSIVVGVRTTPASAVPSSAPASPVPGTVPAPAASPAAVVPTPVRVADLGTVALVGLPTTGYSRTNGVPSVTITVTKTSGANTVQVADAVEAKLAELGSRYGTTITITTVSDLSTFIKESRDGLLREGATGAVFAIVTIFLFLFSLRSTLVAALSIPISILAALVLMQVGGITINVLTLGGLAVAVGRVVDDAIVVLENIYRHRARGEERTPAILAGTREVAGAITASTVTTVGVFLPLGFVGGIVSQFFLPFAITVTFALLASLVTALTVVPVVAYFLIDRVKVDVDETGEPRHSLWIRVYVPLITSALRNRWTKLATVGAAIALFVVTTGLVPRIPTQFLNTGSEKILTVTLGPPLGTSSAAVLQESIKAETIIRSDSDVELVQTAVPGEGGAGSSAFAAAFTGAASNSATMTVRLDPSVDLTAKTQAFIDDLAPIKADGYQVTVTGSFGTGGSNTLSVVVSSEQAGQVAATTKTILAALEGQPDLINVRSDLTDATPEIQVQVDPNKAAGVGSSTAQVAAEVRTTLVGQRVSRVEIGEDTTVDLYVQLDPAAVDSVDALRGLPVGTAAKVPLAAIAEVSQVQAQGSVTRIDSAPAASISADITSPDQGAVSASVKELIDGLKADGTIPPTVDVRLAGVTQQQNEAFGSLFASMGVAVLVVYITMVLTFNSLVTPFVILFSLPLATIGAFPALVLTGRPIGISALIGFLMLIGIVVTNAIVLLDLVERLRSRGMSTHDALVEGGKTRVRPILMTALATMLALIPLAAGFNQGSIIAAELGTVVIGGLFSSTFLTLIVVPVVYSLVDGLKRGSRRAAPVVAEPPPATEGAGPG
jgi:HAE1 family hydrophobic/amphiphilic exporter-1